MTVFTLVCLCWLQACTPADCPQALPSIPLSISGKQLAVEIAATPEARQCGLSRRNHLAANSGMLFVYAHDLQPMFWMKHTAIPLSIVFIDAHHSILAHHDMAPHSTEKISSDKLVRYALEVNQGWFENNAIKPGDKVRFSLSANTEIR